MTDFNYSYDLNTDIGRMRLRIGDKFADDPIFADEELAAMLAAEADSWKAGAALALETIATSEVLIQKVIKILGLTTDGAKVAAELRSQATLLRSQAVTSDEDGSGLFDVAEWQVNAFGASQIYANILKRQY